MKKYGVLLVSLIVVILTMSMIQAYSSTSVFGQGGWTGYNRDSRQQGFINDEIALFGSSFNETQYSQISFDTQFQPIIYDIDNDSVNEIIMGSGFYSIFRQSNNVIFTDNTYIVNNTAISKKQTPVIVKLNNGKVVFGGLDITNNVFKFYQGNKSFTPEYYSDTIDNCIKRTQLTCNGVDKCYTVCQDSNNQVKEIEIDLANKNYNSKQYIGKNQVNAITYYTADNTQLNDEINNYDLVMNNIVRNSTSPSFIFNNDSYANYNGVGLDNIFSTDASIEFDFKNKYHSTITTRILISKLKSTGTGWKVQVRDIDANTFDLYFYHSKNTNYAFVKTTTPLNTSNFHNIIITYNGSDSASLPQIYTDGTLNTQTVGNTNSPLSSDVGNDFIIGDNDGNQLLNPSFEIKDLIIYNKKLNSTEVTNAYNTQGIIKNMDISDNYKPILSDVDNDGIDELGFICDYDQNGQFGFCLIDSNNGQFSSQFTNGIATSTGVVDNLNTYDGENHFTNPMVVTGLSGSDILLSYYYLGTCNVATNQHLIKLITFDGTGTANYQLGGNYPCALSGEFNRGICCTTHTTNGINEFLSQPVKAIINGNNEICTIRNGDISSCGTPDCVDTPNFVCFDSVTGTQDYIIPIYEKNPVYSSFGDITNGLAVNEDDSFTNSRIFISNYTFKYDSNTNNINSTPLYNFSENANRNEFIGGNFKDERNFAILMFNRITNKISFIFDKLINKNPILVDGLEYDGYIGIPLSPICKGSSVTIQAKDCNSFTECNYNNDISTDKEIIVLECGNGEVIHGGFDFNNPKTSCVYNNTGNFIIGAWLTDEYNYNLYPQSISYQQSRVKTSIVINVIDGQSGLDCDLGVTTTPSINTVSIINPNNEVDKSVNILFGSLLGTNSMVRLIIGLGLVIGIIIMVSQVISNAVVVIMVGVIAFIMVTFLGFIPSYILILFIISGILLVVIKNFVLGGNSGSV